MTDNNLFPAEGDQTFDTPEFDQNKDYLSELVGEGKKFKTPEELARGKAASDMFINHLTQEMKTLKEDYLRLREESTSRARLEEIVEQLKSASNKTADEADVNGADKNEKPVFDPTEVEKLIERKYSEIETARRREANRTKVVEKLREKFGSNYRNSLREQAGKLGLDEQFLVELAERSPEAFMKTIGLDAQKRNEDFFTPPDSERQGGPITSRQNGMTWSAYEKLRKEKPEVYYDKKTQIQMHKDRARMGDEFFDA